MRADGLEDADYAAHVTGLKKKIPPDFTVAIAHPFVVASDLPPAEMNKICGVIKWAVTRLKEAYFSKDPDDLITVWLFKDEASYRKYTKEFFGYTTNVAGGYSPPHRALIVNMRTGGGTLIHEIVHPFMHANFPRCPTWFNKGLASLYEQSSERDGHIIGLTNWRLAGLQKAVRAGTAPSFKQLCSTTEAEFHGRNAGLYYAQARYLCYYLQERGLLVKFYHGFVANQKDDPTGYKTL